MITNRKVIQGIPTFEHPMVEGRICTYRDVEKHTVSTRELFNSYEAEIKELEHRMRETNERAKRVDNQVGKLVEMLRISNEKNIALDNANRELIKERNHWHRQNKLWIDNYNALREFNEATKEAAIQIDSGGKAQ